MGHHMLKRLIAITVLPLGACALGPPAAVDTGLGKSPRIGPPHESLLPTVNIAPVQTPSAESRDVCRSQKEDSGFGLQEAAGRPGMTNKNVAE